MDGRHSSSYFQIFQSLYRSFGDCIESNNYSRYHRHFHVPRFFFISLARSRYLFVFSLSFEFTLWSAETANSVNSLFCWLLLGLVVWPRLDDPFVSENARTVCAYHSPGQILGCVYTICSDGQIQISCTIPCGSPCPRNRI